MSNHGEGCEPDCGCWTHRRKPMSDPAHDAACKIYEATIEKDFVDHYAAIIRAAYAPHMEAVSRLAAWCDGAISGITIVEGCDCPGCQNARGELPALVDAVRETTG